MTIDAPGAGKPATRVSWLLRKLRDSSDRVCVEAIALRQRGRGPVRSLAEMRRDPKAVIEDSRR